MGKVREKNQLSPRQLLFIYHTKKDNATWSNHCIVFIVRSVYSYYFQELGGIHNPKNVFGFTDTGEKEKSSLFRN